MGMAFLLTTISIFTFVIYCTCTLCSLEMNEPSTVNKLRARPVICVIYIYLQQCSIRTMFEIALEAKWFAIYKISSYTCLLSCARAQPLSARVFKQNKKKVLMYKLRN